MSTIELDVYRVPEQGREGGVRLVTVRLKEIATIEDNGNSGECLMTLNNGRGFTVCADYNSIKGLMEHEDLRQHQE